MPTIEFGSEHANKLIRPQLRHCPFCGEQRNLSEVNVSDFRWPKGIFYVQCQHCNARGPSNGKEEAARAAWNNREEDS